VREGWVIKELGDVCRVVGGGTPPKDREDFYKGSIPWATVRDMRQDIISDTEFKITELAVKSSSTNVIPANSVVIATRVGLGKICFVERDTAINQDLRGILPIRPKELSAHFLFWWFKSVAHLIEQEGTGATVQGVKLPFIKSLQVPLPPLREQKRIIAILDEAFQGIDAAIANAERNLANVRELFEVRLQRVSGGLEPLGDLVEIRTGKLDANAAVEGGRYPFFTCAKEVYAIDTFSFDCEAILLAGNNAVGDFNVKHYKGKFNAYQRTYVITVNSITRVNYRFLYFQMMRNLKELKGQSIGTGTKFLKIGMIKDIAIPLPTLPEQEQIAAALDAQLEQTERLQAIYRLKLDALRDLKQAILRRAFAGELTAQPKNVLEEAAA
jgi:type I restriction enzyme S subunit